MVSKPTGRPRGRPQKSVVSLAAGPVGRQLKPLAREPLRRPDRRSRLANFARCHRGAIPRGNPALVADLLQTRASCAYVELVNSRPADGHVSASSFDMTRAFVRAASRRWGSDRALSILERAPRIGKRDGFVFTTTGETAISGWSKAKSMLDTASGVAGWRLHDLRRTFATGLAGIGVALPVVEKILNHVSGSFGRVAGVYQRHAFTDEKRDALDKWAARVAAIVGE